ncbi:matrix metalloproteinase-21-like [Megalops cyprinoides]|uniref:matrix metalloproteinase-21-like n=1 Tax=Megalops cyprinoides TaxID=118141 RepID=UPI00186554A4|nr:matrix metalloproteinase-21-like [Megalops cyprinoides]
MGGSSRDWDSRARRYKRSRGPSWSQGPMPGMAFAKQGLRWRLLAEGHSAHLPAWQQRRAIALAFRRWSEVAPLSFQEDSSSPGNEIDIRLGFGTGRHLGCPWLFDGPGGELAHTAQPGEIHLDDDEPFSVSPSDHGVNLLQVALHEIGHVLGLPHLSSPDSVMNPLYPTTGGSMELDWQDRRAIQELYGKCEGPFDTVFDWVRKGWSGQQEEPVIQFSTYFLRGDRYWLYDNRQGRPRRGDPRSLEQGWRGLPTGGVDAYLHIWTTDIDRAYFFKGTQYWRYNRDADQTFIKDGEAERYPQCISEGFPGIAGPLDTAVFLQQRRLIYFFKGHQVWAYNVSRQLTLEGFPKSLEDVFPALVPNDHPKGNLDAAYYSYSHRALFLIKGLYCWEVSTGGDGENALQPQRRVAEQWQDLCDVHPSSTVDR